MTDPLPILDRLRSQLATERTKHADELRERDSHHWTVLVLAVGAALGLGIIGGIFVADEILPRGNDVGVARGR